MAKFEGPADSVSTIATAQNQTHISLGGERRGYRENEVTDQLNGFRSWLTLGLTQIGQRVLDRLKMIGKAGMVQQKEINRENKKAAWGDEIGRKASAS